MSRSLRNENTSALERRAPLTVIGTAWNNLAFQDVVTLSFHLFMLGRISIAPESTDQMMGQRFALALFTVTAATLLLVRGELIPPGRFRALFYRLGLFLPVVSSYFEMRFVLQGIQPELLDLKLLALDELLMGTTPAVWLERFNTTPIIEWFSFFYYSYFYLMAVMIIPTLFFDKGQRRSELLIGAAIVACVGHTLYTFVPGAGPHATLTFEAPIQGGFFWQAILDTVAQAGAQLDIFPSLHTAYPTLFALHAFGNRDRAPFKYVWPIVAIFAAHMIGATLLLRWHWFVDVLAGLALASTARWIAITIAPKEELRGTEEDSRQRVWEPLFPYQDRQTDAS